VFALRIDAGATYIRSGYRTNGLLWWLALVSLSTPWLDHRLRGTKYQWDSLI